MTLRGSRLWQDSLAHATIYEGDVGECAKWLGYAKQKLQFMLHNTAGPLTATFNPAADVTVRVDTRPNRIYIFTGGGDYVTFMGLGAATSDKTIPPLQSIATREYIRGLSTKKVASRAFAGGIAGLANILGEPGSVNYCFFCPRGFWSNGRSESISWRRGVFYYKGRYADINPIGQPYLQSILNATVYYTGSTKNIWCAVREGSAVKIRRFSFIEGTSDLLELTETTRPEDTAALYPFSTTSYLSADYASRGVTTLTETSRSLLFSLISSGVQTVTVREYNEDFTTFTDTVVASLTLNGFFSGNNPGTFTESTDYEVINAQPEKDTFGLLKGKWTAYSRTFSYSDTGPIPPSTPGSAVVSRSTVISEARRFTTGSVAKGELGWEVVPTPEAPLVTMTGESSSSASNTYTQIDVSGGLGINWFTYLSAFSVVNSNTGTPKILLGYSATKNAIYTLGGTNTSSNSLTGVGDGPPTYDGTTTRNTSNSVQFNIYKNNTIVGSLPTLSSSSSEIVAGYSIWAPTITNTPPSSAFDLRGGIEQAYASAQTDSTLVAVFMYSLPTDANLSKLATMYTDLKSSSVLVNTARGVNYNPVTAEHATLAVANAPYTLGTISTEPLP